MSLASDYNDRIARQTELELSAEGLERFAALPPARRKPEDVVKALTWAAKLLESQSELIAKMRVGLQPFAMAAPRWKGHDTDVVFDGKGFTLQLHHFRSANRLWHSRLS